MTAGSRPDASRNLRFGTYERLAGVMTLIGAMAQGGCVAEPAAETLRPTTSGAIVVPPGLVSLSLTKVGFALGDHATDYPPAVFPPGSTSTYFLEDVASINNQGSVMGHLRLLTVDGFGSNRTVRWHKDWGMVDAGLFTNWGAFENGPVAMPKAMNESGFIVGNSYTCMTTNRAFLWRGEPHGFYQGTTCAPSNCACNATLSRFQNLIPDETVGGVVTRIQEAFPFGLSNSNIVVGDINGTLNDSESTDDSPIFFFPWKWTEQNGAVILGCTPGSAAPPTNWRACPGGQDWFKSTGGMKVNDVGQVIAAGTGNYWGAFNTYSNLGTLVPAGHKVETANIAQNGTVVGAVVTPTGRKAFKWSAGGAIHYLTNQADCGAFCNSVDSTAAAMNQVGEIAGIGKVNGKYHVYLWSSSHGMKNLGEVPCPGVPRVADVSDNGEIIGDNGSVPHSSAPQVAASCSFMAGRTRPVHQLVELNSVADINITSQVVGHNAGQPGSPSAGLYHWAPGFARLQNYWTSSWFLNQQAGGQPQATNVMDDRARWSFEKIGDFYRIRNKDTGDYLHTEYAATPIQAGTIQPHWWSAQWQIIDYGDYVKIRNRWRSNDYLHVEYGYLQSGPVDTGWHSARWILFDRCKPNDTRACTTAGGAAGSQTCQLMANSSTKWGTCVSAP